MTEDLFVELDDNQGDFRGAISDCNSLRAYPCVVVSEEFQFLHASVLVIDWQPVTVLSAAFWHPHIDRCRTG